MFQDEHVHYKNGDLYRRENIEIFDDVTLINPDASQVNKYTDGNVKFGTKGSSVRKTQASSNGNDKTSYTYNIPGLPYVAEDLDSIDVDFQPEVSWKTDSVYPYQDWDLPFGYDIWSNNWGDGSGRANVGVGKTGNYAWHDHLRIHSTIDFGEAYPVRQRVKDKDSTDRDML